MILDKIVASTRKSVAKLKAETPLADLERRIRHQDPPRDFAGALNSSNISLIAEIKRASPSRGLLRDNLSVSVIACLYSTKGAAAISVLTEQDYFLGSFADLEAARTEVELPLLCKDFIIDRYQIFKARSHGADAVLVIAAILTKNELNVLLETAYSLGMTALVEVHNHGELEKALTCKPRIIGINNRNLTDFSVDLETTLTLRPAIPSGVLVVSESGIHTRDDVLAIQQAGIDAILIGEALVTSSDPAAKIDELLGHTTGRG